MTPVGGWEGFELHEELEGYLWNSLKLRENKEGDWSYMSFTSLSSAWELVVNNKVLATVMLESGEDEKIRNLSISVCDDDVLSSNYLKFIFDGLSSIFQIKSV
jgi:hypothetical protein